MLQGRESRGRLRQGRRCCTASRCDVPEGTLVTLIGSNGAGKTTTLRALSGMIRAAIRRRIRLGGADIAGLPSHEITRRGLAHSPEGRRVFSGPVGAPTTCMLGAFPRLTGARPRGDVEADLERMFDAVPAAARSAATSCAGTLSGGEQQMLAMAPRADAEPARCCCSTSRRWAWRRAWWRRCSPPSRG